MKCPLNFIEELTKNVQSLIDKDNDAVEENDKEIFLSTEPKVCKLGTLVCLIAEHAPLTILGKFSTLLA